LLQTGFRFVGTTSTPFSVGVTISFFLCEKCGMRDIFAKEAFFLLVKSHLPPFSLFPLRFSRLGYTVILPRPVTASTKPFARVLLFLLNPGFLPDGATWITLAEETVYPSPPLYPFFPFHAAIVSFRWWVVADGRFFPFVSQGTLPFPFEFFLPLRGRPRAVNSPV